MYRYGKYTSTGSIFQTTEKLNKFPPTPLHHKIYCSALTPNPPPPSEISDKEIDTATHLAYLIAVLLELTGTACISYVSTLTFHVFRG